MSEAPRTRRWWPYWLPALAVMALIFLLSSQSGLRVTEDVAVERPLRVSGHLLAYAALASLLLFALCRSGRPRLRHALLAFGLALLYAVSDELHQAFVPDRTGRAEDVLVDAVGAAAGLAVAWLVLAARVRVRPGAGPPR